MKSNDFLEFIHSTDHKILDVIDLLQYDNDLESLYALLRDLNQEYFAPNERIVVVHFDTEYFYHGCATGFTTHNFFSMIRSLGFPLHVFTFITNYPNYDAAMKPFVMSELDRPETFNPLVHFFILAVMHQQRTFVTDVHKQIEFHAMSLLGTARSHRVKLCQFIQHHGLGDKINYTFSSSSAKLSPRDVTSSGGVHSAPIYDLIYSHPHRINDSWANFVDNHPEINCLNAIQAKPTTNPHLTGLGVDFYNSHAIDIVAETTFDYPSIYLTEKTFRPILMETPFIMLAPQGTLRHLRSVGLETFGDFWNESYDDISDPRDRFLAVTKVIQQVCDQPLDHIRAMYRDMQPKLQHNKNSVLQYIKTVTEPLYNKLCAFDAVSVADIKNL